MSIYKIVSLLLKSSNGPVNNGIFFTFFSNFFFAFIENPFLWYRFGVLKDEKTRLSQINQKYFVKPRGQSKNQIKTTKPIRKYQNQRPFEKTRFFISGCL